MAALRPLVANYARNTLKPPEQTKTTESESLVGVHIRSERERPDCVGAVPVLSGKGFGRLRNNASTEAMCRLFSYVLLLTCLETRPTTKCLLSNRTQKKGRVFPFSLQDGSVCLSLDALYFFPRNGFVLLYISMKYLEDAYCVSEIEIHLTRKTKSVLGLSQKSHIQNVLKNFGMYVCM
jgi:hypothetical protein